MVGRKCWRFTMLGVDSNKIILPFHKVGPKTSYFSRVIITPWVKKQWNSWFYLPLIGASFHSIYIGFRAQFAGSSRDITHQDQASTMSLPPKRWWWTWGLPNQTLDIQANTSWGFHGVGWYVFGGPPSYLLRRWPWMSRESGFPASPGNTQAIALRMPEKLKSSPSGDPVGIRSCRFFFGGGF